MDDEYQVRKKRCCEPTLDTLYPSDPVEMIISHYEAPSRETFWEGCDSEERYTRNGGHPKYGPTDIVYKYNAHGYRGPEFDEDRTGKFVIAVVGCSNTKGVGLPYHETYVDLFSKQIEKHIQKPVLAFNLGQGGSSNDKIALRALKAADVLKPDYMVVQWSFLPRVVYVQDDHKVFDWWNLTEEDLKNPRYDHIKAQIKYTQDVQNDWNDAHRFLMIARTTGMILSKKSFGFHQHMMFRSSESSPVDRMFDSSYSTVRKAGINSRKQARDYIHSGLATQVEIADELMSRFEQWATKNIA